MNSTVASPPVWLPELQRLLSVSEDLEDLLRRVTVLAAAVMPADTSCVIAVEPPGRPLVVVGSEAASLAVGTTDWTHREGPHLVVTSTGRSAYSPDISKEGRWSAFVIEARARGIRCALTCPIQGPDEVMGVLSLYATRPHAYDEIVQRRAQGMADSVAGVITLAARLTDQIVLNEDLHQALVSRAVIDQAIGVIMAENRCSRVEAFGILRSASQNRNAKLRDVAANLVQSITGHEPMPGPFGPRQ
jgi:GAF domain-containing protein